MKKLLMVFTIGLLSFNALAKDRWEYFGKGGPNDTFFFDTKTKTPDSVWVKRQRDDGVQLFTALWKYDCKSRSYGIIHAVSYYPSYSTYSAQKIELIPAAPDSVSESLLESICKR